YQRYADHRHLHSFPTRRSSDLWSPRGPESNGAVRLQSEEERSRPRCAGDLSREGGKRAVTRALPREAVIEHQYIIGSTLPFSNQDRKSTRLNSSHVAISYAVFC